MSHGNVGNSTGQRDVDSVMFDIYGQEDLPRFDSAVVTRLSNELLEVASSESDQHSVQNREGAAEDANKSRHRPDKQPSAFATAGGLLRAALEKALAEKANQEITFTLHHADHGISEAQLDFIKDNVARKRHDGFFIQQVNIPSELGTVPCGLYGPAMGDEPVKDEQVELMKRSEDRPPDRMLKALFRPVDYVQVIGIADGRDHTLFTIFGGPLAPKNPQDPSLDNEGKAESVNFWSQHALAC